MSLQMIQFHSFYAGVTFYCVCIHIYIYVLVRGFPGHSVVKNLSPMQATQGCGFNPWVKKIPWNRNGNPLQYHCLENPMDKAAWWATIHGTAKSRTRPSTRTTQDPAIVSRAAENTGGMSLFEL